MCIEASKWEAKCLPQISNKYTLSLCKKKTQNNARKKPENRPEMVICLLPLTKNLTIRFNSLNFRSLKVL